MSRPEKSLETKLAEIDRESRELGVALGRAAAPLVHDCPSCLPARHTRIPIAQRLCAPCQRLDAEQRERMASLARESKRHETRTEADMAERYDTIKLRLPRGDKARLEALAETEGMSSAKLVSAWIGRAERELRDLAPRKATASASVRGTR